MAASYSVQIDAVSLKVKTVFEAVLFGMPVPLPVMTERSNSTLKGDRLDVIAITGDV